MPSGAFRQNSSTSSTVLRERRRRSRGYRAQGHEPVVRTGDEVAFFVCIKFIIYRGEWHKRITQIMRMVIVPALAATSGLTLAVGMGFVKQRRIAATCATVLMSTLVGVMYCVKGRPLLL